MAIALVFEGITQEQYEESVRMLTGGSSLSSPSDWPTPGLLAHIAGQGQGTFRVVDVWESQEAVEAFGAKLMPILRDIGVQGDPEIYPVHTFVSA